MASTLQNLLGLIGHTPLMRLNKVVKPSLGQILVKLENRNPSGSVKDRLAYAIVGSGERSGELVSGDMLVWATSGNSGTSLAFVGMSKGYPVTIFMPSNAPLHQRKLLRRYGAKVELTSPKAGMAGALEEARRFADQNSSHKFIDVFSNPAIVEAHYSGTGQEILDDIGGAIDAFVSGIGTGATITGVGKLLKENIQGVKIIGVEPTGSPMISSGLSGSHMIPGIGPDFIPPLLDLTVIDDVIAVADEEAYDMTLRLCREEGLLAGISAGANVSAAIRVAQSLEGNSTVVTIIPDTGERYLDVQL